MPLAKGDAVSVLADGRVGTVVKFGKRNALVQFEGEEEPRAFRPDEISPAADGEAAVAETADPKQAAQEEKKTADEAKEEHKMADEAKKKAKEEEKQAKEEAKKAKKAKGKATEPEPAPADGDGDGDGDGAQAAAGEPVEAGSAADEGDAPLSKAELKAELKAKAKEDKRLADEAKKKAKDDGKKAKKGGKEEPEPEAADPQLNDAEATVADAASAQQAAADAAKFKREAKKQAKQGPGAGLSAAEAQAAPAAAAVAAVRKPSVGYERDLGPVEKLVDEPFDDVPEAAERELSAEEEAERIAAIEVNTSPEQERALRDAAQRGAVADCKELLEAGVSVDGADASGFTPLIAASCHGHAAVVAAMLKYNASDGHADGRGLSACHWAVSQRHTACCALLVQAGAALEGRGGGAQLTPFLLACKNQDFSCIEILVHGRCDVTALSKHNEGSTAVRFMLNNDGLCARNDRFCTKYDGLCTENDGSSTSSCCCLARRAKRKVV